MFPLFLLILGFGRRHVDEAYDHKANRPGDEQKHNHISGKDPHPHQSLDQKEDDPCRAAQVGKRP
jgi:hypothetical protein